MPAAPFLLLLDLADHATLHGAPWNSEHKQLVDWVWLIWRDRTFHWLQAEEMHTPPNAQEGVLATTAALAMPVPMHRVRAEAE